MSKSNILFKSTIVYTIGNVGSKVLMFLLLPLFSFYLTKSDLGIYDLLISSVSLLVPIVTLQISDGTYRWLLASDSLMLKKKAISNGFLIIILCIVIFYIFYAIAGIFFDLKYQGYFILILTFSCFLPFCQQVVRGLGYNRIFSTAGIVNACLILLLNFVLLVYLDLKLEALFLAMILANFLTVSFIIIRGHLLPYLSLKAICKEDVFAMLNYSLPLVPNMVSWWLINAADKFIILYVLNTEANGIYAISSRFPTILTLFNSIFILSWQDQTISSSNDDSGAYNSKVFDRYVTFELSAVFFLIATSEYIVKYFLDKSFYDAFKYMPILYIGVAYSAFSGYFGAAFLKEKKTKDILISSLVGGLLNVMIGFSLIRYIGLYAPVVGTFLSFLVMFLMRVYQSRSFFAISINYQKLIGLTFLCFLGAYLITLKYTNINILMIVSSVGIGVILNKATLLFLLNKIKGR